MRMSITRPIAPCQSMNETALITFLHEHSSRTLLVPSSRFPPHPGVLAGGSRAGAQYRSRLSLRVVGGHWQNHAGPTICLTVSSTKKLNSASVS